MAKKGNIKKDDVNDKDNIKKEDINNNLVTKIPSGIEGFDEISRKGIPRNRTTLVSGTSGSGKTIFAVQFLYNGIVRYGENGVFVTFEEDPTDIIKNMNGFGWDIETLIKQKKWMFVDASPVPEEEVEVGKYDLGALMARIKYAVETVNAERISIDSISALFPRYEDPATIRNELFKVTDELKKIGITIILTAERPTESDTGLIARFGVEEFVSDNVVLLHNRLEDDERIRTIEILKFRGSDHETEEAPIIIDKDGMTVFPRPKPTFSGTSSKEKISIGVKGLDEMLNGGVYKNSTTLITGASGTGKTVAAMQFILDGAKKGENGLYIAFEESEEQLFRNADSFGWPFRKYVKDGTIRLLCKYPEEMKSEEYYKFIKNVIAGLKVKRFVMDSISGLERIYKPGKFREFTVGLNAFLKSHGITSLLTNTTASLLDIQQITETHLSTLTDNIILLKYLEMEGQMKKIVDVLKCRGSDHDKRLREYNITSTGVQIGQPFVGFEGLMSGSARRISISFGEETAEREFLHEIGKTDIEPETGVMPEVGKASTKTWFEEDPKKKGFIEKLRGEMEKRHKK